MNGFLSSLFFLILLIASLSITFFLSFWSFHYELIYCIWSKRTNCMRKDK